jgi:hypothetical protein
MGGDAVIPWITLYGGECDGYRQKATLTDHPDIFYVPSLMDLDRIKGIKDQVAKAEEFKKSSRLAYEFHSAGINAEEVTYKYRRCQCDVTHDREIPAPAQADGDL